MIASWFLFPLDKMLRTSYNLAAIKFWPHRLMVRTPPFQGENPGSNPSGAAKIINDPNGSFFILPQVPRRIRQSANGTHGEYADKQLANPQKRICYIRVFAWCLIIVYQGGEWGCPNNNAPTGALYMLYINPS